MLLLLQNEIGQIVARSLTSSENNTETAAVLADALRFRLDISDPKKQLILVCDNADAVRGMVNGLFDSRVQLKQDPFNVVQRIQIR